MFARADLTITAPSQHCKAEIAARGIPRYLFRFPRRGLPPHAMPRLWQSVGRRGLCWKNVNGLATYSRKLADTIAELYLIR